MTLRATSPRRQRLFRRLARDERGVSAIEFALVAPLVFILILGTVEVALDMIVDASVQFAAQQASRAGLTTVVPSSGTRDAEARRIVYTILGGWRNIGGTVDIGTRAYSTYNDIAAGNYQETMGGFGDVVLYNISVTMPTFSGIPKLFGIETMTFQRSYLVQNEK
ncbi:TadE family protein [Caballeronia calidae]|uniref:TadE family protein n=1 Tax=Caballeronia calidae TaxID=1777139 RepID=A0A158DTR6_9BURK|nr:TadE/TadG family type IV pilus assembly protein [Caballeronia calidae]SAK97107.1 TadE family protein [Caballeronia calidae]